MTEPAALQKLLVWLSPAFPVGAYAWSAGLETAIAERRVTDASGLENWIEGALAHGGLRNDTILLAQAYRAFDDARALAELADLCLALTPAAERRSETLLTGEAFATAARAWPSDVYARLPRPCPYPIAVGAIAGAHAIGVTETLLGYIAAAVQSQVSVAVRLVPIGQTDELKVMAALEGRMAELARIAASSSLDDIGGIAYAADIAQMRHETEEPRIFPLMSMLVAALIFVPLLAIAIAHLLWAVGASWPIRDKSALARTVIGRPGVTRVPKLASLVVAICVLAAEIIGLSLADESGGGLTLTLAGALLAAVFLARGAIGYTAGWRAQFPEEPFATLDRRNYSPLSLFIGAGFLLLVLMRLI